MSLVILGHFWPKLGKTSFLAIFSSHRPQFQKFKTQQMQNANVLICFSMQKNKKQMRMHFFHVQIQIFNFLALRKSILSVGIFIFFGSWVFLKAEQPKIKKFIPWKLQLCIVKLKKKRLLMVSSPMTCKKIRKIGSLGDSFGRKGGKEGGHFGSFGLFLGQLRSFGWFWGHQAGSSLEINTSSVHVSGRWRKLANGVRHIPHWSSQEDLPSPP